MKMDGKEIDQITVYPQINDAQNAMKFLNAINPFEEDTPVVNGIEKINFKFTGVIEESY